MQSPQTELIPIEKLDELAARQWITLDLASPNFPVTLPLQKLRDEAQNAWRESRFKPAAVGRGSEQAVQHQIRSDSILWIDWENAELQPVQQFLSQLQLELNQGLMLGIQAFEAHLARFAEGQFYQEHIDQPKAQSFLHGERLLSFVLYLNHDWKPEHGGQLQIRHKDNSTTVIEPTWGRLALFDSKEILHQVLPSQHERWSLTGWFRRS